MGGLNSITQEKSPARRSTNRHHPAFATHNLNLSVWLSFLIHQMGITTAASQDLCEDWEADVNPAHRKDSVSVYC